MEALLEAGADPNLTDDDGNTPLAFARERDESAKIELLKAHGAEGGR